MQREGMQEQDPLPKWMRVTIILMFICSVTFVGSRGLIREKRQENEVLKKNAHAQRQVAFLRASFTEARGKKSQDYNPQTLQEAEEELRRMEDHLSGKEREAPLLGSDYKMGEDEHLKVLLQNAQASLERAKRTR